MPDPVATLYPDWPQDNARIRDAVREGGVERTRTRASVLNRLCSHEAFHAGEISQLLGLHGVGEIDLWRRDAR